MKYHQSNIIQNILEILEVFSRNCYLLGMYFVNVGIIGKIKM